MRPSKILAKIRAGKVARVCSAGILSICLSQVAAACRKLREPWIFPVGIIGSFGIP